MYQIGIVGAAGYSGIELIKLLSSHEKVRIAKLFGHSTVGSNIEEVHPSLNHIISMEIETYSSTAITGLDLIFVALPSGGAFDPVITASEKSIKVIDLGGDFRLSNSIEYKKYYKHDHKAEKLLDKSIYGLSEWNEEEISTADIIANPGCYPTSILLPLIPILKNNLIDESFISIISYSGTTGAGKSNSQNMIFSEINESVRAYKVGEHQHIPEIKKYLKKFTGLNSSFSFVPHLLPVSRGIYSTIQVKTKIGICENDIIDAYKSYYNDKPFIRFIENKIPEMKHVLHTNFCDIGFNLSTDRVLTIFSTIDNLLKGAAGQAVQNMNIMFGLDQSEGIMKCLKK
ncbi:MAG: N-acetyl-gamma-glutamyl-phosphate reductase [Ignavibacteriaceae bacterium]|jgi:N-acetyl-gamma-glutamyl-phosphate reductase|nr:N-acetyl-gamma-glutamyl-phosphate reductase [Ignavibacteriaceae bacterium]